MAASYSLVSHASPDRPSPPPPALPPAAAAAVEADKVSADATASASASTSIGGVDRLGGGTAAGRSSDARAGTTTVDIWV